MEHVRVRAIGMSFLRRIYSEFPFRYITSIKLVIALEQKNEMRESKQRERGDGEKDILGDRGTCALGRGLGR